MSRRIPENYTILIARTGRDPLEVSLPCRTVLMSLMLLMVSAGAALAIHQDKRNRDDTLTKDTTKLLKQLKELESQVDNLRQRAGIAKYNVAPPENTAMGYIGGQSVPLESRDMLKATQARITSLSTELKHEVEPALTKTLTREAARPLGIPLRDPTSISSTFGRRANPFSNRGDEFHDGVDLSGGYGTPIYATAPGVVEAAGWSGGYGKRVIIDHSHGYRTLYGHMSEIEVAAGTLVERGQLIGYVGSTGRSTGPHLHYSVYYLREAVDPQNFFGSINQSMLSGKPCLNAKTPTC